MTLYEYAKAAVWLAGLATGACAGTHAVVKADFSERFGKALAGYDLTVAVRRWPSHFVELFDSVFSSKHWSWFCFRRSCYFSLGGLAAVIITYFVLASVSFSEFVSDFPDFGADPFLCFWAVAVLTLNFVPDYLSLLETRWLISRLGRNPSLKKLAGALLLDLVLTGTIFIALASVQLLVVFSLRYGSAVLSPEILDLDYLWFDVITTTPTRDTHSIYYFTFYTTFLTSVWVWMLGGSVVAAKLLGSLGGPLWRWLSRSFLDFETKPFLALGWIAGASVLFGALLLLPVLLLTGNIQ